MEKKGTSRQKRRPKGDPNPQKGPPREPRSPKGDPIGHSANGLGPSLNFGTSQGPEENKYFKTTSATLNFNQFGSVV